MRIILILLLLFSCATEEVKKQCCKTCIKMTISDSLPIQFWLNGEETFNEKQICGVYQACFCQPFECDDEITIQFTDTIEDESYLLLINDSSESELQLLEFEETVNNGIIDIDVDILSTFATTLEEWQNNNGSNGGGFASWSAASPGAVATGGGSINSTKYLSIQRQDGSAFGWPPGEYSVRLIGQNNSAGTQDIAFSIYGMSTAVTQTQIFGTGSTTLPDGGASTERTYTFTLVDYYEFLAVRFDRSGAPGGGFNIDVLVEEVEITGPDTGLGYLSTTYNLSFTPSEFSPPICEKIQLKVINYIVSSPSFIEWETIARGGVPWTITDSDLYVSLPSGISDIARRSLPFPTVAGEYYKLNVSFDLDNAFATAITITLDGAQDILPSTLYNSSQTLEIDFIANGVYSSLDFFGDSNGNGITVTQLSILNTSAAVAQSDCIDLKESHPCTEVLAYTNTNDFDGIVYDTSPPPTFYLRIPAQFWKEDNPMTQEDSELSNGVIVTRRQSIQEKTLLEVGFVPNYMHKKIQKVLMHETVMINDQTYKRRDEYEAENINRYPLKRGTVWLTKYNSVEKNTI